MWKISCLCLSLLFLSSCGAPVADIARETLSDRPSSAPSPSMSPDRPLNVQAQAGVMVKDEAVEDLEILPDDQLNRVTVVCDQAAFDQSLLLVPTVKYPSSATQAPPPDFTQSCVVFAAKVTAAYAYRLQLVRAELQSGTLHLDYEAQAEWHADPRPNDPIRVVSDISRFDKVIFHTLKIKVLASKTSEQNM